MPSIIHVAREAKVAISTVSLTLNSPQRVSAGTRRKVERAIRQVGYRPRETKRKYHIGVLYSPGLMIHGVLVDYCRQWITAVRETFEHQGADVSLFQIQPHIDQDPLFARNLESGDFDALVTMGVYERHGYLDAIVKQGTAIVAINHSMAGKGIGCVSADHPEAGRAAAAHLAELGHRRLALGFPASGRQAVLDVRRGFLEETRRRGLEEPVDLEFGFDFDDLAMYQRQARRLMEAGATGCFCGSPSAMRIGDALGALGVDVPRQMSLLGLDNLGLQTCGRRLTTLESDAKVIGRLAGQMVQQMLDGQGEVVRMSATVAVKLIAGQTVEPVGPGQ
jgi:DNA-binding LacI/PurR family transcriptional regulator